MHLTRYLKEMFISNILLFRRYVDDECVFEHSFDICFQSQYNRRLINYEILYRKGNDNSIDNTSLQTGDQDDWRQENK